MTFNPQTSPPGSLPIHKIRSWLPISLILLLATILYLYQLGTETLGIDEYYSIRDAEEFNILNPGVRPLYFILLQFWMNFGKSDAWLRGLSVIFGLGNVFLTYQIGRRTAGEMIGIISAFLLTLSPIFVFHAQEVRMYSMSTFIALVGTLILIKILENLNIKWLILWAIARVLTTLTSPLNILILFPDLVIIAWTYRNQRRVLLSIGICLFLTGLLIIPSSVALLNVAPKFFGDWVANLSPINLKTVLSTPEVFTVDAPSSSKLGIGIAIFFQLYSLLLLGLIGVALFYIIKHRIQPLFWIAAWAFLPGLPILLMSYAFANIWFPRYLLFTASYLFILLAIGFIQIFHRWRYLAAVIGIYYLIAVGWGLTHYYTTSNRVDWPVINQVITSQEKPGDVIIYSRSPRSVHNPNALSRYYQGQMPIELQVNLCAETPFQKPPISDPEPVKITPLSNLLSTHSRFWVLCEVFDQKVFNNFVSKQFKIQEHQTFKTGFEPLQLFLLVPKSAETPSKDTTPTGNPNPNSQEKT
jgi:Predicted membrane protein